MKMWFVQRELWAATVRRQAALDGSELLEDGDVMGIGQARPAVSLGDEDAEKSQLAQAADGILGKMGLLVPLADVRRDLGPGEVPDHVPALYQGFRVIRAHSPSSPAG